MKHIYLDHSATTPLDARVLEVMLPYFGVQYGNSLAVHCFGHEAEQAVEDSRELAARLLRCTPHEVIFTSGGTESDNLALRGPAQYARVRGLPFTLITSPVEHEAISSTARQLREVLGASLRVVNVDQYGRVSPDDLRAELQSLPANGIALVSLMHTNNEIGTVNPIRELAAAAHEHGALFHTDAVQAAALFDLDVDELGVDLLSLSAHKFYGPKGMGVLFLREGVPFITAQTGAKHEDHRRAGTHNTPGIVGTARALELARLEQPETAPRLTALRDRLFAGILERVPDSDITGHPTDRLPGHASFVFQYIESNTLLMHLDQRGIAGSSGSACKVGNSKPSGLLQTLGYGPSWTRSGLRLTMGRSTTDEEIDRVLDVLPDAIARIRKLTPLAAS